MAWPRTTRRPDKLTGLHVGAFFLATVFSGNVLVSAKYFATVLLYSGFGYGIPGVLHSFARDFWQEPRVIVLFWLAVGLQRHYARAAMPTPVAAATALTTMPAASA